MLERPSTQLVTVCVEPSVSWFEMFGDSEGQRRQLVVLQIQSGEGGQVAYLTRQRRQLVVTQFQFGQAGKVEDPRAAAPAAG